MFYVLRITYLDINIVIKLDIFSASTDIKGNHVRICELRTNSLGAVISCLMQLS